MSKKVRMYSITGLMAYPPIEGETVVVMASDYAELEADRDRLKVIADNYYALLADANAELAKLRAGQEPVLYVNGEHLALALDNPDKEGRSASASTVKGHYCDTPLYTTPQPSAVPEGFALLPVEMTAEFSQFLSAVMDAAGLVRHGRQSKGLSEYLGSQCMKYRLAAAPSAPNADDRPLYTCIGKGGEYRYLGTAIGAGDSRGELAEVYQDRTGQLFHRTPEDFMERMEPIAAARQEGGKV